MSRPPGLAREAHEGTTVGAVLAGVAATFGLVVSSGLLAVVVAGLLQWRNLPVGVDNAIPLVVLGGGLLLSGRVATDVAGRLGPLCGVGAGLLVGTIGIAVSRAGEAHGEGIELWQIAIAVSVVSVLSGGGAWWVARRRSASRAPGG